jgi:cytochrome c oxidase cbb3-type subunit 4
VDAGTLSGIVTAILLVAFLGIVAWAWSRKRKKDFDAAARQPLERDGEPK